MISDPFSPGRSLRVRVTPRAIRVAFWLTLAVGAVLLVLVYGEPVK